MVLDPRPGLVIRYDYLWRDQWRRGQGEGSKDRPCAVILVAKEREDGSRDVLVCPITHSPPLKGETAVEIPLKVGRYLGFDADRSWLKTNEANQLRWEKGRLPFGVSPVKAGLWAYGILPSRLGEQAFEQLRANSRKRMFSTVLRDPDGSR